MTWRCLSSSHVLLIAISEAAAVSVSETEFSSRFIRFRVQVFQNWRSTASDKLQDSNHLLAYADASLVKFRAVNDADEIFQNPHISDKEA